ncbi:MAG: hypothetical protein HN729_07925 [Candidatus Marinimicrobia bacterium]|jgi:hypothetical protein|nr:hypothetical protein [Candidatus Neomarinimicrobiota bacterium]MBT3633067.1 hypothetical protein [Candidatus Neomarinimicrobiota bacterium]MBT3683491.1 hypothetical protein [Candidatus Neomarinimicrobiota bacterium]MBT3758667.1 hypothetical protein [Candidatus Neomarinimicrobiota bacterium]MBT3896424.1 hypothetical protein [Candidatus Neomarinimicrobiota bacterium]
MALKVEYEFREGYIYFKAHGQLAEYSLAELWKTILYTCDAVGERSAVIDCSNIVGNLSITGIYSTAINFVKTLGESINVACINSPISWNPDYGQFCSDVAYVNGGSLEFFEIESDAVKWLARRSQEISLVGGKKSDPTTIINSANYSLN